MPDQLCQMHCMPKMSDQLSQGEILWQKRNRIKRIVKRRIRFLANLMTSPNKKAIQAAATAASGTAETFNPGDLVRVKSWEEIKATLDNWNQLKRCSFMEEMAPYCGSRQRILKPVEKFLDERDYLIKKCRDLVILEDVRCEGTKDFGDCDRACYFFWRNEWLEKIPDAAGTTAR